MLAAGGGRRYGGPKALVRLDGALLVERAAGTLQAAGCTPVVVVLGAEAERVRAEADLGDAVTVDNPSWRTGMGSSLRAGLAALDGTEATAAVVLLVDMPGVTAEAVRRVAARAGPDALVTATYRGRRGHPVVLGRHHWAGASALAVGDIGARAYLTAHWSDVLGVSCEDVADDTDLDVPPPAET